VKIKQRQTSLRTGIYDPKSPRQVAVVDYRIHIAAGNQELGCNKETGYHRTHIESNNFRKSIQDMIYHWFRNCHLWKCLDRVLQEPQKFEQEVGVVRRLK
jgi:hypothetical protein